MVLVVDVGNTNITCGVFKENQLITHWRLSSKISRTEDEIWLKLKVLCDLENIDLQQITGLALGSVVPSITTLFTRLVEKRLSVKFIEMGPDIKTGITIRYDTPGAVGADRICNAVAGFHKFGGPLIIVDFGTATTFDVISAGAEYLGGIIAPGLESAATSLHIMAAKLPAVDLKFPPALIGTTPESSMQSGIMYGGAEMVEGVIKRLRAEMGARTHVIATGGLASILLPELPSVNAVEPDLTLEGLYRVYQLNTTAH